MSATAIATQRAAGLVGDFMVVDCGDFFILDANTPAAIAFFAMLERAGYAKDDIMDAAMTVLGPERIAWNHLFSIDELRLRAMTMHLDVTGWNRHFESTYSLLPRYIQT